MYAVAVSNLNTKIVETQTGTKEQMWQVYSEEINAAKRLGWMLLGVKDSISMTKMMHRWVNSDGQTVEIAIGVMEQ